MESWNSGPHSLELEPPDVVHFHVRAPVEARDIEKALWITRVEMGEKRGIRIYFVVHVESPNGALTSAARKAIRKMKSDDAKAAVFVGGSATVRAATNLMARSMNLLWGNPMPFKMVGTDEEARSYIAERRAQEAAEATAQDATR